MNNISYSFSLRFVCCVRKAVHLFPIHRLGGEVSVLLLARGLKFPMKRPIWMNSAHPYKTPSNWGKSKRCRAFFAAGCAGVVGNKLSKNTSNHPTLKVWERETVWYLVWSNRKKNIWNSLRYDYKFFRKFIRGKNNILFWTILCFHNVGKNCSRKIHVMFAHNPNRFFYWRNLFIYFFLILEAPPA